MKYELSLGSPIAMRCVDALWDSGNLFNDKETLENFQNTWRLTVDHTLKQDGCSSIIFDSEDAMVMFMLRWS